MNRYRYYPFGMQMPGRNYAQGNKYRYGFNGKENDNDVKGEGNQQDYGMRVYDGRLGKFLSVDPIIRSYPQLTPYQFASNSPISGRDLDGKEFVLTIYDPQVASKFDIAVTTWKDIYLARKIAYEAINSTLTEEEFNNIVDAPGYFNYKNRAVDTRYLNSDKKRASLEYDKFAPPGLTVDMNCAGNPLANGKYSLLWNKTLYYQKGKDKDHPDKNYPVDVRIINSPEYKDFYKNVDFDGEYGNYNSNLWVGTASRGYINGYLKGSGFVQYSLDAIGVSSSIFGGFGFSKSGGKISGVATDRKTFLDPSILSGWGAQISGGVSFGVGIEGGFWGSFNNKQDAVNFNMSKATFIGTFGGVNAGFNLGLKGSKSKSGNVSVSYSTLQEPVK